MQLSISCKIGRKSCMRCFGEIHKQKSLDCFYPPHQKRCEIPSKNASCPGSKNFYHAADRNKIIDIPHNVMYVIWYINLKRAVRQQINHSGDHIFKPGNTAVNNRSHAEHPLPLNIIACCKSKTGNEYDQFAPAHNPNYVRILIKIQRYFFIYDRSYLYWYLENRRFGIRFK